MKTLKFYLLIITAIFFITFKLGAQSSHKIEKKIGNIVYELDTINYIIKNKENKITPKEYLGDCIFYFNNPEQAYEDWLEKFKPIFSKERAEKLNVRIRIYCIFDLTGLMHEIVILFSKREDYEKFTLSEIKAMEDTALNYRFKDFKLFNCEGSKYTYFVRPFNPYLLYFDKPKK